MRRGCIILAFLIVGLNGFSQDYESFEILKNEIIAKTIPLIQVDELRKVEKTKTALIILDARDEEEYLVSHILRAKHVGYSIFKEPKLEGIDKETIIVIYCSVGYRSEKVGEKLKKAGFKKVMNLQGGIFDWVNSGYPVYDNEGRETKKIHGYDESWGRWLTKGEKVYE